MSLVYLKDYKRFLSIDFYNWFLGNKLVAPDSKCRLRIKQSTLPLGLGLPSGNSHKSAGLVMSGARSHRRYRPSKRLSHLSAPRSYDETHLHSQIGTLQKASLSGCPNCRPNTECFHPRGSHMCGPNRR